MTKTINQLAAQPEALRKVTLAGPLLGQGKTAWPMWTLSACAPSFDHEYAFDTAGKPSGVTADHVHPLRVLSADQPGQDSRRWMQPRLMSVHIVVGAQNFQYKERKYVSPANVGDHDELTFAWSTNQQSGVSARQGNTLRTIGDDGDASGGDAPFVHIAAELLPAGLPDAAQPPAPDWMAAHQGTKAISVPPMRLVAGRIGLYARLASDPGLAWLSRLGIVDRKAADGAWSAWPQIWLVPDGIEFLARLPFPGRPAQSPPLIGRVLLQADPAKPGAFRLTLIEPQDRAAWQAAWLAIIPAGGAATERLQGLQFAGRRDGVLPRFIWPVALKNGVPDSVPAGTVRIAASDCDVLLASPPFAGKVDSVAALRLAELAIIDATDANDGNPRPCVEFVLDAPKPAQTPASINCIYSCDAQRLELKVVDAGQANGAASIRLDIDNMRLAGELRAAYGLPTPPAVAAARNAGEPYGPLFARPLLPAFVPLQEGWLQLPVPNLGPLDSSSDSTLRARAAIRPPSVLNGFVRVRHTGLGEGIQSGRQPKTTPARGQGAPWSLTVEQAAGVTGSVRLLPRGDGDSAALLSATLTLQAVVLSARGLLWVSTDRPDADEALPRLGAGPAAFVDTLMQSGEGDDSGRSPLLATIDGLTAVVAPGAAIARTLCWTGMSLQFRPASKRWCNELLKPLEAQQALKEVRSSIEPGFLADAKTAALPWAPVVWQRHPTAPLAASMPMTRSTTGSSRPLESRELFPFALMCKKSGTAPLLLAKLSRSAEAPLPALTLPLDEFLMQPVACWPAGGEQAMPERGIALAMAAVPGGEVRVDTDPDSRQAVYRGAVRYDLPLLDEAFATASLPPPREAQREVKPGPDSVATTLDWPLLAAFWQAQERKHQNARVVDSYLCGFGTIGQPRDIQVANLVKGLTWGTRIEISLGEPDEALPYGSVAIAGKSANGDDALLGYSGWFDVQDGKLEPAAGASGKLAVLGFSPGTFRHDGVELDNSRSGALPPIKDGKLLKRNVVTGGDKGKLLVSLMAAEEVKIGSELFHFWFKDALFDQVNAPWNAYSDEVRFDAIDNDEQHAGRGYEWRLNAVDKEAAGATLTIGRSEILLAGLRLEPLCLQSLRLDGDALAQAVLLCRLTLSPLNDGPNLVTLTLDANVAGGPMSASFALHDQAAPLEFECRVRIREFDRRVRVTAIPASTGLGLDGNSFHLEIAGVMVPLGKPRVELAAHSAGKAEVVIKQLAAAQDAGGVSCYRITNAVLTAGYVLATSNGVTEMTELAPVLKLKEFIDIYPAGEHANAAVPAMRWELGSQSIEIPGGTIGVAKFDRDEANGTLWIAARDGGITDAGKTTRADVKCAMLATFGTPADGMAPLRAGHAELVILQAGPPFDTADSGLFGKDILIDQARVEISAACNGDGLWDGSVTIDAIIDARSDIGWPALKPAAGATDIPLPARTRQENDGRIRVLPGPTPDAAQHSVKWQLAGHKLGLNLAAAVARLADSAVWVTPVVAHHTLIRAGRSMCWSGVDNLAIGRPAALVPRLSPDLSADASGFAARYAHAITKGEYQPKKEDGMRNPGVGAVATVFQGALGQRFRKAFWKNEPENRIVFGGGFLGLLDSLEQQRASAPLLRLPVLAGTGRRYEQTGIGEEGIDLAWADGHAARPVALTRPTAPAPANAGSDALGIALLGGSLTGSLAGAGAPLLHELAGAVLVEQSFDSRVGADGDTLAATPFFLAAAVSVSRTLDLALSEAGDSSVVAQGSLSLISGAMQIGTRRVNLAASVAMRPVPIDVARTGNRVTLHVLGRKLSSRPWTGPLPADDADSAARLKSYLTALAASYDLDPSGVLLAMHAEGQAPVYVGGAIASLALGGTVTKNGGDSGFADGRRGMPAAPAPDDMARWLAPPHEGPAAPIRDLLQVPASGSGLAGLSRRVALPAHARAASAQRVDAVWLSSNQTPVYLPLLTTGMRGTAPAWLQPAPPLVRLPTDETVRQAIAAADTQRAQLQGFLPGLVAHASVAERAGIMTVRRSRLLTRLDGAGAGIGAFDADRPQFGAPAQAGSSWARKLRTPRPGPLPANCGDADRDRRIQASRVRPLEAGQLYIGAADIVQGDAGAYGQDAFNNWAVQVVACPESASVISERWDGVLRVLCRIELRRSANSQALQITPAQFLAATLFGADGGMSARLQIGDQLLPFRWLEIGQAGRWSPQSATAAWDTVSATVALLFIPHLLAAAPAQPSIYPPFAALMASVTVTTPMEFQWTVAPGVGAVPTASKWESTPIALEGQPLAYNTLIRGSGLRASLTLRMPLYPVRQVQGALPLTPATLMFSDPAYDRDLAAPPAYARKPLVVADQQQVDQRGDLRLTLYADRARVNRRGVVTLMVDVGYERRMDALAQSAAEATAKVLQGGDLVAVPPATDLHNLAHLTIMLMPAAGKARALRFKHPGPLANDQKQMLLLALGSVYELPLSLLMENDGTPAVLAPGDVLQLDAALGFDINGKLAETAIPIRLWNTIAGAVSDVDLAVVDSNHCALPLTLTDEPVVEPPPALYLALQRTTHADGKVQLSMPLHVQSPLPRRVDLMDPARGFRNGMMQRHADFVWTLCGTDALRQQHAIMPIKSDRNGQTCYPADERGFLSMTALDI